MNTSANKLFSRALIVRRTSFFLLSISTAILMLWLFYQTLHEQTPPLVLGLLIFLFSLTLPWMIIGFWNAIIGFLICLLAKDPLSIVLPPCMQKSGNDPLHSSTAILLCIRNEDSVRVIRNLEVMIQDMIDAKSAAFFHIYILSDSNNPAITPIECIEFEKLKQQFDLHINITYRLRNSNEGYKAGNIAHFCHQYGALHDFAVTLDADSFMTSAALERLVRLMQGNERLGILQGLVVGLPSSSAFTRLFQFGMRLGMRSYTMGSAWWQSDYGPYWGHNAIIRLQPFINFCELSKLPSVSENSAPILSHDLLEAILMRRAGYEVRVYPLEDGSWEANPTTLHEYIRRDLRWCEGNLQYVRLLGLANLDAMGRFQLMLAIFMFLGSPAWIALIVICTIAIAQHTSAQEIANNAYLSALIWSALLMWYLPKIAGALYVLFSGDESTRFGGRLRFFSSLVLETLFSLLMTPISWLNHTIFIASLAVGHKGGWSEQMREDHSIGLLFAVKQFWPHTLLGIGLMVILCMGFPDGLPYGLLFFGGLIVSIPLAVITSQQWLGNLMMKYRLLSLPEEIATPKILFALGLKALQVLKMKSSS